ncbi:cytochrome c [Microvirga sp. 2YAF29]|uniref:c-type cytochrome n=1 Tax=Microvirga sp. 2YAF29 TaxID=3233031 RepID=UPI003F996AA6
MRKTMFILSGIVVGSSLGVVAQHGDPIAQRQNLMKNNQEQVRLLTGMARGQTAFDAARAKAALQAIERNAEQVPALFPAGSHQGKTAALPVIWERKADFDARSAKLAQDAKAAQTRITDQAGLQAVIQPVGQNCGGCHEVYRKKES